MSSAVQLRPSIVPGPGSPIGHRSAPARERLLLVLGSAVGLGFIAMGVLLGPGEEQAPDVRDPVDEWSVEPTPTRVVLNPLPPEPQQPDDPAAALDTAVEPEVWDRVADCESGTWDADGQPRPGSARWDYGLDFDHGDRFEGGLNFHPDTWDAFRDEDMPDHAGRASRVEQIEVAEHVLDAQGWDAWPVCSRKMDVPEPAPADAEDDTPAGSGT